VIKFKAKTLAFALRIVTKTAAAYFMSCLWWWLMKCGSVL